LPRRARAKAHPKRPHCPPLAPNHQLRLNLQHLSERKPEGTGSAPSVNFPALDRPGYKEALSELIKAHGLTDTRQLDDYLKWIDQASAHGDLTDPAFRAQVLSGKIKVAAPATAAARTTAPAPLQQPRPSVPAEMSGPAAADLPVERGATPERPVIQNGAISVPAPPDATPESLLYRGFYDLGKSAQLSDAMADRFASQIASEGMPDGETFAAKARAAGQATVGVRPENLQLLQQYVGGQQSGANIEAQMTGDTGVMQSSTDEDRRHEQELRRQAEAEVAAEMPPEPRTTPEGVPSPDPSRDMEEQEARAREVNTRVNQRLAMERVHGELSALTVDREKLKGEMRTAIEGRMEDYAAGKGGKFGQEYGAGMLGADDLSHMLPGRRMSTLDRMAEEETDALIKDIDYAKRSTDPNAAIGVVESVYQRFRKNPFVLLPVMATLTDLDNTLKASGAQERIAQAQAEGRAPEQRDELTVRAHQAAQHVNQTITADIANLVVEQPAFWGEFALMGPANSAIEETVGRGLARVGIRGLEEGAEIGTGALRSRLGARVLGDAALSGKSLSLAERSAYKVGEIVSKTVQTTIAGGAMTGTVGVPRIAQEYVERRMKGEDGPTAFVHSVLNQAGEYVSEFQGDVLELMPGMKRLNDLLRPVMRNFETYGYHGIAGEIYEEAWKDFIWDPATALSSAERKQRFAEAVERWSDPRTWGVMVVGFGLPGVGGAMYGHASAALSSMRQEYKSKADEVAAHIAELQQQPASEETAEALAQAQEEHQHYTGLVEQIDTHEQEVAKQEAEVAAAEQQQPAATVESSSEAGVPDKGEDVPAVQGGQVPAANEMQPAGTPVPAGSHERDEVTGVTQAEEAAPTPALVRSEAEDFADEITREMGGGDAEAGGQVDEHGFREFPAERGSLGVRRAQMPQVKSEHRGALVNYLEARGIEHEEMMVRPSSLKPTQAEYSPEKVQKAREYEGGNRAILVSGDGYVLDGQHQLEKDYEDAPEEPVRVIALHGDAKDLLPLIHDFPSSTVNRESEGGPKEAPTTAESFADEMTGDSPTTVVDQILSPEHPGNVRQAGDALPPGANEDEEALYRRAVEVTRDRGRLSTSNLQRELKIGYGPASRFVQRMREDGTATRYGIVDAHVGQQEAAPSSSGERGLDGAQPDNGKTIAQSPAVGESPNMSTPVTQGTGVATTDEQRAEIRGRREDIKAKLAEARRKRLAAAGAVEPGSELRHGGPALPSREEVVLTAELLLTYAQEGTLLFKDAARRFRDDVGAEYARELSKAFETGWRLLKKKGHEVDEAANLADELEAKDERDESQDGGAGGERGVRQDAEAAAGEDHEETKEEDVYVAPDPLEAQDADPPRVALGRKFARALLEGKQFPSITHARKFASEGRSKIEAGTQEAKDVDEAVEIGVGIAARAVVTSSRARGQSDEMIYQRLVSLYTTQQPNLSVRTSTSALEQAYSTPAPLAFVASRLAGINRRTSVLGNTAGNGMLLIEAAPETLVLNEKNSARFGSLEALFPLADVRQGDALSLKLDRPVDRYVENPPFGVVKEGGESRQFEPLPGYKTTQIDHAIAFAGLGNLTDKGRAVLIVGSVQNEVDKKKRADQYDAKDKRLFYYHLYQNYNVADHFTVSGDLYERQGAGWPVDVIVIDGRGKSERRLPAADPPRVYKTWDELAEVLKNEHVEPEVSGVDAGDRPEASGGADGGGRAGAGGVRVPEREGVHGASGRAGAGDADEGGRPETGAPGTRGGATGRGDVGRDAADGQPEGGGRGARLGQPDAESEAAGVGRAGQAAEEGLRGQPGGEEASDRDESGGVGVLRVQPPERAKVDVTQTQVPYMPASRARGMATLTPVNMATAAQDALDALIKRLGGVRGDDTLDRFVADRLDYKPAQVSEYFGAEQVDAIALAIDNIERGAAMILGDQTGIGKGRPVAAVLEYARRQGKTPIFITEKPNLYKDMARDLMDIGAGSLEELRDAILMTNASKPVPLNDDLENPIELRSPAAKEHNAALAAVGDSGQLPEGKHYIFTTYSQMQKIGQETARQRFLRALADGAVIVFDESHNAGGSEQKSRWGGEQAQPIDPLSRAGFARELIDLAHGVFYSSATFAKRPSVMDLYSKTDMRYSVSNVPLAEMIAKGGVPLQQVVSSMLVESGQMLRRERSFQGIEYATALAPVDQESAETVSSVMRAVFDFDKVKKEAIAGIKESIRENAEAIGVDPATGAVSADSTAFSSLIHNLVDQMLLSLKMESAIEHTLESLRAGEKPVITVSLTFGSFLEKYAEDFKLQPGEAVGLNFGDMLKRYLDRTRELTYKRPDNTTYKERLTDEQLGPKGVALYEEAAQQIQEADWSKMPVSPLDYIKYRIESEIDPKTGRNYKVGEITGRTEALDYTEHFKTKGEAPPYYRRRSSKERETKGRIAQIVGFNEGSIDAMILNQAGSTGLSLHASERVSDRRPRHMIVAQPERNIDTHMQLLGRVNRTGQVVLPRYTQLVADIPSEKRPAAVLAKKMASLNANTTAARGSKFKAESVVDFMNQYGDQVAFQLMENNPDLHERLGEPLATAEGMTSEEAARKVTGRLPILSIAEAAAIYDELEQEYNDLIERVNALGENALEAQTLALDAKTVKTTPVFEGTGTRPFERGAVAEDVDVKRLRKPYSAAQVLDLTRKSLEKRFAELKVVEAVPTEDDLGQLAQAGEHLQGYQREATREEFDAFVAKELEAVATSPRKDETQEEADSRAEQRRRVTETRYREVMRRWQQTHARYHTGQTVMVTNGETGDLYGVITDIARTGRTANPAALGAWKLTIALADAARSVNIPFSKLRMVGGADEDARTMDDTAAGSRYTVQQEDEASIFDRAELKRVTLPVLEAFERGQSVTRERRIIITGNVFAGFGRFEKSRGQIINFTDDKGNLRQGILMPQDFDVEKALDDEPIIFKDAGQVTAFLTTTPGLVTTTDGHFKIAKQGNNFKFTAPRARGVGQKYWGNTAVLDAAGQDFVTKGDYMTLVTSADTGREVIKAALLQGWTLQTNTHKERAREVTGTERKGGATTAPYRERFAGGVGAQGGAPSVSWGDLVRGAADKVRGIIGRKPDAAEWNYSGFGGVKTRLVRNLSQLERAAPPSHASAVRAAGTRSLSRVLVRRAAYRVQEIMRQPAAWDAFRATLIESRLIGIKSRWRDLADLTAETEDEDFRAFYAGEGERPGVRDLVQRFERSAAGKEYWDDWAEGGRVGFATAIDAMVAAGDFDSARMTLAGIFDQAAVNVANVVPATAYNAMADNDQFQEALRVYKELLERPMAESHALNEGVFSDALGPLDTYYPLIPLDEDGEAIKAPAGSGFDAYRIPSNIHNRFTTGLAPQYDLSVEGLEGNVSRSLRANAVARLLRQLETDGLARPLKKNDPDERRITFEGREYEAKVVRVGKDRVLLREGQTIHLPARRWAVAAFAEKELRPILEGEDFSHSKITKAIGWLNAFGMAGPLDAAAHTANMIGAVVAGTPYAGTGLLSKTVGNTPATKLLASVVNLLRTDVWDEQAVRDIEEMTALGVIPTRYASVASGLTSRGRDFAAKTGAEKKYVSLAPLIYGPAGIDIRARLLLYRISQEMDRATGKAMTARERTRFINQLGNYTYELQGDVERFLKKHSISPFYTAGSTMWRNGINIWLGRTPLPKSYDFADRAKYRAATVLSGGAVGLVVMWALLHLLYRGLWPWDDKKSRLLQIPLNDRDRDSWLAKKLYGDNAKDAYVGMGFFSPLVERGAHAVGAAGAYDAWMAGGTGGQIGEGTEKDIVNSAAHPFFSGPAVKSAFVMGTTKEPYLQSLRDSITGERTLDFRDATKKAPAGTATTKARIVEGVAALNNFYGDIAHHLGFVQDAFDLEDPERNVPEEARGSRVLRSVIDLVAPRLIKGTYDVNTARKRLEREDKAARSVRPAAPQMPAARRTKVERALAETGVELRSVEHTLPYPGGSPLERAGKRKELTQGEVNGYQQEFADLFYKRAEAFIDSPDYATADTEHRREVFEMFRREAHQQATERAGARWNATHQKPDIKMPLPGSK
jgi:hypothetical protein